MTALNEAVSLVLNAMSEKEEIWAYLKERNVPVLEASEEPAVTTYKNYTVRTGELMGSFTRELDMAAVGVGG